MKTSRPVIGVISLCNTFGHHTKKEKILYILFFCFLFTFYLPTKPFLNNIVIWLGFVLSFGYNSMSEKVSLLRERPAIILMILFFGIHLVSSLFSLDQPEAVSMLVLRWPLVFLPLAVGTLVISPPFKNRMLLLYAVTTTITAFICLVNACRLSIHFNDTNYLYNDWLSDAIKMQSVYFSLMVTLAIFSYVHLLLTDPFVWRYKIFTCCVISFMLAIQILLGSRIQLLFFYGSTLVFIVYYLAGRQRKLRLTFMLVSSLVIITIGYFKIFPKTANRFKEFKYPHYAYTNQSVQSHYNMPVTPEQWNGINLRLAIWNCGWDAAKKHLMLGVSLGDKKQALQTMYRQKDFDFAAKRKFNMHNTYLDVLLAFGIVGLLLFVTSFFVLPLKSCITARDFTGAMIIATFLFALFTETYLDRSMGCVLIGFFIPFVLSTHKTPAGSAKKT
jgi:O-antigen ligase